MRTAILDLVYVGLGGFIGSISRYLVSGCLMKPETHNPLRGVSLGPSGYHLPMLTLWR